MMPFMSVHSVWQAPKTPSFILFRREDRRPASQAALLLANLPQLASLLEKGAVVVFEDVRIRVRPLPIHGSVDET